MFASLRTFKDISVRNGLNRAFDFHITLGKFIPSEEDLNKCKI
ncbi:hypothetical protein O163_14080 [Caldanaerobacter subterraneus subsp. yonseiensis KB-1]|uniref:Uncharacterized protein n=1 Tax=Caldanaerobacter subterraneus subsp. yonseiensis KB-1 TaxID=1388761 RepID=U5CLE2_CALSX|nr:hypothetical protein O163_14080 [Caldanaerobacter subterraneus subsp. yonseiensis KB-1]